MKKLRYTPRGSPFSLKRACSCGGNLYRHVTHEVRGSHPMISIRRIWNTQCQVCGVISSYEPSPEDIAKAARKTK